MISLLSNPALIVLIVAATLELVSARIPQFKGAWVLGASFLLSMGLEMAYQLSVDPKGWSTGVLVGLIVFVSASGGKDLLGNLMSKKPSALPEVPPKE